MATQRSGGGWKLAVGVGVLLAVAGSNSGHHHGHGLLATLTSSNSGHHHHHHGHGHGGSHGQASAGGNAGCRKLERLWMAAGGNPAQAQTAASIAMAESSGNAGATDYNSNGTVDRGYWQINSIHGAQSTYDPMANARAAVAISGNGSNWTAWTTFNSGAFQGKC